MRGRSLDRAAAIVSLVLLTGLGLFTFYLSQVAQRDLRPRSADAPPSNEPDYFVDRLALLTMNERGEPSFRLEARQLRHFPVDNVTEFEEPVMVSLAPERPRVTITANRGKLLEGGVEAHLSGDVVVTRAATANAAPMVAETPYAIVLPDEDLVRTDQPVSVLQGGNRLTGVGMELNNRTRQLRVDSQVRAVIQPPPKPAPTEAGGGTPRTGAAR
jgi:lipopolysaccharide export system protein LptC